MKWINIACLFLGLLVSNRSFSQITLATSTSNNGSGGIFLTLTTNSSPVNISKFNTYFNGSANLAVSVQIYTRTGAYSGFTASSTGWTLVGTASATAAGTTVLAPIDVTTFSIQIPSMTTQSFYLHSVTSGGGIRYSGTTAAPPVTTYSDANLTLFSDVSRTGTTAFAGTQNSPRTFAGSVEYTLAPLSLKWLSLSGNAVKDAAMVSWDVQESGAQRYDLERQDINGFISIASLNSKGEGRNTYSVTDANAFADGQGLALYRVKQTNKAGQASYSITVAVKRTTEGYPVSVFPSPFNNELLITAPENQSVTFFDITGKRIATHYLKSGVNNIVTREWLPGVYLLQTADGKTLRLLKK